MPRLCVYITALTLLTATLLCGCQKDNASGADANHTDTAYTIALIYPIEDYGSEAIHNLTDWFQSNLQKAQIDQQRRISLNIEWYDENREDLKALGAKLRLRPDIMAVVGPITSTNAEIIAAQLRSTRKTLILPSATSAELVRPYAGKEFFWTLTETDITQCEILLNRAINAGAHSVALLAGSDIYGQTFTDWFAFQAQEMGLQVSALFSYDDPASLTSTVNKALSTATDCLICAPSSFADVSTIWAAYRQNTLHSPPALLFSDISFTPEALRNNGQFNFLEGITPCADPQSGFDIAFKVHTGHLPTNNEAQIYDALILATLAITGIDAGAFTKTNDALSHIVATTDSAGNPLPPLLVWHDDGLSVAIDALRRHHSLPFDISGATGPLDFDSELHTCVVHSVYAHFIIYGGNFITLNHLSADGTLRTESSLASWNRVATITELSNTDVDIAYTTSRSNYALLIAASEGWKNYRHQADVLTFYHLLRSYGYDDDHIILILRDDIAFNPQNPDPGHIYSYDDTQLYHDILIDYNLDTISADDIERIITGQRSPHLPTVIDSKETTNLLVFWSGHGTPGSLLLANRGADGDLTTDRMRQLLLNASASHSYRKMLWLIETCYSASVAIATEELNPQGVLMITAANAFETSKADRKIDDVYRTNRFTMLLTQSLQQNPYISFRDLYYNISRETIGSHATIFGDKNYGNLFSSNLSEYLIPSIE